MKSVPMCVCDFYMYVKGKEFFTHVFLCVCVCVHDY